MEETFAGLVAEFERAIRPLGFKIDSARRIEAKPLFEAGDGKEADREELEIIVVRPGKLG